MITAQEARERATTVLNDDAESICEQLARIIEVEADNGNYELEVGFDYKDNLKEKVRDILSNAQYTFTETDTTIVIRW